MKGVTRNREVNRLIGERNASLRKAASDSERQEVVARYARLIREAKWGQR